MRIALAFLLCAALVGAQDAGWVYYGGDAAGSRYSPGRQITPGNVAQLKVAWTYHTGALQPATALNRKAAFEATPILAMYSSIVSARRA